MKQSDLHELTEEQLGERLRALTRAYDEACLAHDAAKSKNLHGDLRIVEKEIRERTGGDFRRTGHEDLSADQLIQQFMAVVIEYSEADGMPESERLYWEVNKVRMELERRAGDQRRALIPLYTHPDIRIRQAAAEATRTLASALSHHRLLAIDDPDWSPPLTVPGMSEAELDALFPKRRKGPPKRSKLQDMTVDQLVERFKAIAIEQDEALMMDEIPKYNRLFSQMDAVEEELNMRDGDQRRTLMTLYVHPNAQAYARRRNKSVFSIT